MDREGYSPSPKWVSPVDALLGEDPSTVVTPAPQERGLPLRRPTVDFDLPVTFRNWNFAKSTIAYAILTALLLWLNVESSWGLEWLGVGLLVVVAAATSYFGASWRWATLRVEHEGVHVGGVMKRATYSWDEVDHFSIMDRDDRTPFMLVFWRWRDQARLVLSAGGSVRVRAIEPRHGFTVLTYAHVREETDADQQVAWLNRCVHASRANAEPGGNPSP